MWQATRKAAELIWKNLNTVYLAYIEMNINTSNASTSLVG